MLHKKSDKRFPYLWAAIYGALLTGYTVFTLLNVFVLPHDVVRPDDVSRPSAGAAEHSSAESSPKTESAAVSSAAVSSASEEDMPVEENPDPIITANSYQSEGVSVTINTRRAYGTEIYIADVVIKDPSYLRTALANGVFGRNITDFTSSMAEKNNAILAINGDYYGFRDNGFVMRNGYLYRSTARPSSGDDALVIYTDGRMEIVDESGTDIEALTQTAGQIFCFGPGLIRGGEIVVDESSEVDRSKASNPRTAIGEISPLHYILLVSDGRTAESRGLSLLELAEVMRDSGCETAYNLDGGGSSTMWFMGRIVNRPTSNGTRISERSISDIVYIGE